MASGTPATLTVLVAFLTLQMVEQTMSAEQSKAPRSPIMNTVRDPQIAVQEEYDAAIKAGTTAALDLFIARHPDNVLAARAKQQRAKLP